MIKTLFRGRSGRVAPKPNRRLKNNSTDLQIITLSSRTIVDVRQKPLSKRKPRTISRVNSRYPYPPGKCDL